MSKKKKLEELERYFNDLEKICLIDDCLILKAMMPIEQFCNRFLGSGYVKEKFVELQCALNSKSSTKSDVSRSIFELKSAFERYGEDHQAWKY